MLYFLREFFARPYMKKSFLTAAKFFGMALTGVVAVFLFVLAIVTLPGWMSMLLVLLGVFCLVWACVQDHYKSFGYRP